MNVLLCGGIVIWASGRGSHIQPMFLTIKHCDYFMAYISVVLPCKYVKHNLHQLENADLCQHRR